METVSRVLSRLTNNLHFEDLSPEVIRLEKMFLLDTLGVAIGGYLNQPSQITRSLAKEIGGRPEATIIGSGDKTSSSMAALANGVMVRYLDFMDFYFSAEICHATENIPTALAVGERQHSTGKDILLAIHVGFEAQCRFADTFPSGKLGWHFTSASGYITPLVAGKLLGLTEDQMVNAIGIAGCTSNVLSYFGSQLSMIKAMGYALGAQRGIEAAIMAQKGMTGPDNVFELFNQIMSNQDLSRLKEWGDQPRILKCALKPYAAEFMALAPLEAMYNIIKKQPIKAEDVEAINIKTFEFATRIARPETYRPETRETADHSLPYCLAIGLIEGDVGPEQFTHEQWKDPRVLELMSRVKVSVDPDLNKLYPKARPVELEIVTKNGESFKNRVDYPKGDPNNPMSDNEVQSKFRKLAKALMSEKQIRVIIDCVNNIEQVEDIGHLMMLLNV